MRRYESYKDSGVEWLGEVPSHWESFPLFVQAKISSITNHIDKELLSVYLDRGVVKFSDVDEKRTNVTSLDLSKYQLVRKGNLVLNNQQAWRGSVGISNYEGIVSPAYLILELSNKFDPHYANYLFRNGSMVSHYLIASKGVGTIQRNLYWGNLRRTPIFIPPLSEQQKIAQFLDDKTAKIDQAVDLAEKQIALLKEHKQILIQNAVTRGLNPDVPLKDSGVEWIGQVPEHWEVKKLKFVLTLSNKKEESKNSNKRYIGMENIESFTGKINDIPLIAEGIANSFYKDEILFGKLRPYLAKSYLADFDGICSTEFLVYRSTKVLNNRFALNIFLSYGFIDAVNASTYGSKMPRANAEFISNMFLAIPPLSEQKQIIDYLDKQTAKIDQAIALKTAHIEKLKEYKSVLINDVVTGKVRVSV
jgi:restriction endonuclease, S subunit